LCDRPALRERLLLSLVLDQHEFDGYQSPNLGLSWRQHSTLIPTKQLGIQNTVFTWGLYEAYMG
jgi:hypothetical protein